MSQCCPECDIFLAAVTSAANRQIMSLTCNILQDFQQSQPPALPDSRLPICRKCVAIRYNMSQCSSGCDMAAANCSICRKLPSYVANRKCAAICTAVATPRADGQQIVNLPQICRNVSQVATYCLAAADWNICREVARYVANRKSAAIFTTVPTARAYGRQIVNLPYTSSTRKPC